MSLAQLPLTIIVAATAKNGIGKANGLPWPMLKKDMAYFARVTKRVPTSTTRTWMPTKEKDEDSGAVQSEAVQERIMRAGACQNVVIMGRKTWESIPPKFRPLKDRTNIVISSQGRSALQPLPDDVVVAADIVSGLQSLEQLVHEGKFLPVGRAYIIGGTSIYEAALKLPQLNRILLTRIEKEYDCDTFFPVQLDEEDQNVPGGWRRATHAELQRFVQEDVAEGPVADRAGDQDIAVDFQLYERA